MGASAYKQECEQDMNEAIDALVASGDLTHEAGVGIARKVAADGVESLSEKQAYIYRTFVHPKLRPDCNRCQMPIEHSELSQALDNGGYCGWCEHMMNKDD